MKAFNTLIFICLCATSTMGFADCFYIKNTSSEPIKVEVQYNNRDQEKSPALKQLYLIQNNPEIQAFPLNTRDILRGLVDYQFILVQDRNHNEICHQDFSNISANKELKIQLNVLENSCEWKINELGSLDKNKRCQ